jgi:two-component system CheB/CheR fusion protein
MDGFETAQRLQQEAWGRDALLIALTGWGTEEDIARTKRAGFHAHLVKPLNLPELLELLGKHGH